MRCDPDRVAYTGSLLFHPDRPTPPAQQRASLDAVAELMHRRRDILLLRIEVSQHQAAADSARQRRAMQQAQRRADALLSYLWRRRGVSAERMEAVGLSAPLEAGSDQRWTIRLRILQWAPLPPGGASSGDADARCDQPVRLESFSLVGGIVAGRLRARVPTVPARSGPQMLPASGRCASSQAQCAHQGPGLPCAPWDPPGQLQKPESQEVSHVGGQGVPSEQ